MLWLLLAVGLVFLPSSCFAFSRHGWVGLVAAGLSGLICLLPACLALYVTATTAGSPNALAGTFFGIFLRTVVPFAVSLMLVQISKPLADAGLFGLVLINYLVVLAVETFLAVRIVQSGRSASMVV